MFKLSFLLIFSTFSATCMYAQNTVNGFVSDADSGERIIGASIFVPELKIGVTSNEYGFYSITLPKDSITLVFSYVGCSVVVKNILQSKSNRMDIEMKCGKMTEEIEIRAEANSAFDIHGQIALSVSDLKKLPVLMSESDIMKSLQFAPGVAGGTEGTSGLHVRGGSPDQNLILLDGGTIYNATHLYGFLSVFNSDALNSVKLYKGGIPARFGERLSSVLEISVKEGNLKRLSGAFSISPILGSLCLESPILKNKASVLISARRTWLDILTKLAGGKINMGIWDINAKVNAVISPKSRIFLSFYTGRDAFSNHYSNTEYNSRNRMAWGNDLLSLRFNKILSDKIFVNFTLLGSKFKNLFNSELSSSTQNFRSKIISDISEVAFKTDFDCDLNPETEIKFGYRFAVMRLNPEQITAQGGAGNDFPPSSEIQNSLSADVYIEDNVKLSRTMSIAAGLRISILSRTTSQFSQNLQPNIAFDFLLNENSALHLSYFRRVQFLHLLTGTIASLPSDLWVISNEKIGPSYGNQFSLGYSWTNSGKTYSFQTDTYYKTMNNVVDYAENTGFLSISANNWTEKVYTGKGEAYGTEFSIHKNKGKLTGWIAYTLSYSFRQFKETNNGEKYPYRYDRRHNLSIVTNLKIKQKNSLSCAFVFNTGHAFTLFETNMAGVTAWENQQSGWNWRENAYSKNNVRMPVYHRIDVSYQTAKQKKKLLRTWTFSVYNLYNQQNAFSVYPESGKLKKLTLFPILPSLGYRVEF